MKKLSIFILIIVVISLVWFSGVLITTNKPTEKIQSIENTIPSTLSQETLSKFSSTVIEKRCPFYKPNGVGYRDCLSSWVEDLENNLLVEQINEVENYCSSFVKKVSDENSIEGGELYLQCEIYKLQ